ncbi:LytR family transcriptional regulator [Clavibacter michiganensis]|uniref:LytR family transcriptional regulator n=1 Tax=Clavibacter michiganensis TaxID=28447 RepID=A0A2S5VRD6_9MICO|nr:LCP family protein [Clavibacter michiganensis]PPF65713.1 LytR family transcriptional regulator [Clavibacter michiganensis]
MQHAPQRTRADRARVSGIARHGRLRAPSAGRAVAKAVAAIAAVSLVATVSVVAIAFWDLSRTVSANQVDISGGQSLPPSLGGIDGGANILIVGSDSRAGQGDGYGAAADVGTATLNDVTMLLHISEDSTRATVVSFPRDMLVPIPACEGPDGTQYAASTRAQLNESLSRGGFDCTVRMVEGLTGLDIPYGGVVQFNGVVEMSNAVGGVEVCVANGIYDPKTDLSLDPGLHSLKGKDAVQFLRTRYGVGDGSDISRIGNQQVFLSALVRTIKSTDTLTNPAKLYGIARAVVDNMQLSTSLADLDTLVSVALTFKDIPLDDVVFLQYPGTVLANGRVQPDEAAAAQLVGLLASDADFSLGQAAPSDESGSVPADGATTPPATEEPPTDGSTPTPTPSSTSEVLDASITGQTAAQNTCSNGQG